MANVGDVKSSYDALDELWLSSGVTGDFCTSPWLWCRLSMPLVQNLGQVSDVNRKELGKMQKQMSTTMLLVVSIGTLNLAVLGFLVFKLIGG